MFKTSLSPRKTLCSTLSLSLLLTGTLPADTIILKTGERLDAKISRTTDTTVEADVKMSASVTDLRIIQKADIERIEKPDPAEAAFLIVKPYGPRANSRSPLEYGIAIDKLKEFLKQYPDSNHVPEVEQMVATLEKGKKRVSVGDVKVEYIWYTAEELEKQKDQVSATLLLQQIRTVAQSGDTIGALNLFNKLEKAYPGTRAYPDAVDFAMQLLPRVQTEINTKRAILANDLAERKKGLDILPDFKKAPLIAAAAAEDAKANAALEAATKSGAKWTPIYPRHAKSIDTLQTALTAEASRMNAIKTAPMHESIAAADEVEKQIIAGDLAAVTASLQKATTLWSANLLTKEATSALTAAKATPTPTPTPVPTATPKPTPKPVATPPPAAASSPTPEEENPAFYATIPGAASILGGVALLAGIVSFVMKSKGKKSTTV